MNPNSEPALPAISANTQVRCLGVTPKAVYDLAKAGSSSAALVGSFRSKIAFAGIAITFGDSPQQGQRICPG